MAPIEVFTFPSDQFRTYVLSVGVGVGVVEAVGLGVADLVGLGVVEGVAVLDGVGVGELDGVGVAVLVGVAVADGVGETATWSLSPARLNAYTPKKQPTTKKIPTPTTKICTHWGARSNVCCHFSKCFLNAFFERGGTGSRDDSVGKVESIMAFIILKLVRHLDLNFLRLGQAAGIVFTNE